MFIVKYDLSGNVIWAKRVGGTAIDQVRSITADTSGNVYIAGFFASSAIVFGSTTLTNAGSGGTNDLFVAKYSSTGSVLWAVRAGGINDDESIAITADETGLYVTGVFTSTSISFSGIVLTNISGGKTFIAKYAFWGGAVWAKSSSSDSTYGGYPTSITTDASGEYITGNYYGTTAVFGPDTLRSIDSTGFTIFLIKYDVNGNQLWARSSGSTNRHTNYDIDTSIT
jgi:hypothetical protein